MLNWNSNGAPSPNAPRAAVLMLRFLRSKFDFVYENEWF